MNAVDGLSRLEAQVSSDLEKIAWPGVAWVKPRRGPDGAPMLDALVIGAGQGGLTVGFALKREGVERVLIIDRAPSGLRGPWTTYGRMKTLRSPKQVSGPDLDIPSLTFRSWFEAQRGREAWDALGKIPKELWSAYLGWFERVLALPVRAGVEALAVRPVGDHVAVDVREADGRPRTIFARQVVVATGIETPGRWRAPDFIEGLPRRLWAHAGDEIDFAALRGRRIAVLGAGASAFDNAAAALEAGAAEVHVFFRRPELQRVQPYKQISYAGFLRHMGDLDDALRWRFMRHLLTLREAFPAETHARVAGRANATLHPGAGWTGARPDECGGLRIETAQGPFDCDFAICGTGFAIDLAASPTLAALAPRVALWCDRYAPPPGECDARLAAYPYLGPHFELTALAAEDAAALARVRLFTFAATMSFGPSGSSINALKFAAPRLAAGLTRALFTEGAGEHLADLLTYDAPEF
ncbi:NAD(P)-binding domain-containing protein [Rubrimonas cliftonensis]|uniref:Predicted flavoprotein CzcO associated with the cation diffusion facilitator CzcD n=1 Tax=Rubrimonas cliftonensis TaxID=89524 RepID=A0A1H3XMH3_9RHOB|nr:NAD(P)-binding domain-containing protein [Rubrimonas cliftonensis]SDZ99814.1 Predicted flavoprotein CzcO associated with the cation diffusion facilitator CzcD [Rubrimonas cliftonensis]